MKEGTESTASVLVGGHMLKPQTGFVPSIEEIEPSVFSYSEMLRISGVTADSLFTWVKRKVFAPYNWTAPGKGHKRRYGLLEVAHLYAMKTMVDIGLPLGQACDFGFTVGWDLVKSPKKDDSAVTKQLRSGEGFLLLFKQGRRWAWDAIESGATMYDIREKWMGEKKVQWFLALDVCGLMEEFQSRQLEVFKARSK